MKEHNQENTTPQSALLTPPDWADVPQSAPTRIAGGAEKREKAKAETGKPRTAPFFENPGRIFAKSLLVPEGFKKFSKKRY